MKCKRFSPGVSAQILRVFEDRSSDQYFGENVSQLEHALQAVVLARRFGTSESLVVSALLHEVGHLIHVDAKRYLWAVEPKDLKQPSVAFLQSPGLNAYRVLLAWFMDRPTTFSIRAALPADTPALTALIERSVRELQKDDYTPVQLDCALATVYGVDTQLVADGTYFVVEAGSGALAGCGGWSKRKTLYGGDQCLGREDSLLNPATDAAKIRAFFVHPDWVRRGVGTLILETCESAAIQEGFTRFEMGATLTGVALYRARGYEVLEPLSVPLANGDLFPIVRMAKDVGQSAAPRTE